VARIDEIMRDIQAAKDFKQDYTKKRAENANSTAVYVHDNRVVREGGRD
jgi:hypothetical protein